MKTYFTYENGKKATMANNKKEASIKLGVNVSKVIISHCHIDFIKDSVRID